MNTVMGIISFFHFGINGMTGSLYFKYGLEEKSAYVFRSIPSMNRYWDSVRDSAALGNKNKKG